MRLIINECRIAPNLNNLEKWVAAGSILDQDKTQCKDEFRNLSGCVTKNLAACRMLQISIARCQIKPEIHIFPTMYGKGGRVWSKLVKSRFPSKN